MQKVTCILLVDDDDITNSLHSMLLEDMDVTDQVKMVTNANEALEQVRQNMASGHNADKPCLMFLDINMPGISGFEMLERLQNEQLWPADHLHVYILSSSGNQRDLEQAEGLGVSGYMVKPLTRQKIEQVIKEVYGSQKPLKP